MRVGLDAVAPVIYLDDEVKACFLARSYQNAVIHSAERATIPIAAARLLTDFLSKLN